MSTIEAYVEYVQEQIEEFTRASNLIDEIKQQVTPLMLNSSLACYSRVNAMLNAEYQRKKFELMTLQRSFQAWWDGQFSLVKRELSENKPASYKLAVSEIESEVRSRNCEKYEQLQSAISEVEMRTEFILRMLDQWKAHAKILEIISNNMRQEISSFSVENRMNRSDMKVIRKEDQPTSRRRLNE